MHRRNTQARSFAGASPSDGCSNVQKAVLENPVTVIGIQDCCICHALMLLFQGLGVNPAMYEVVEDERLSACEELEGMTGVSVTLPMVFIGGKVVGGMEKVIELHISGGLVPILKDAGALWL